MGYWESRGYPNNATVQGGIGTAMFDVPVVLSVAVVSVVCIAVVAVIACQLKVSYENKFYVHLCTNKP